MPVFPPKAFKQERFQWPVPGRRLGGLNVRDDEVTVPFTQFTKLKNVLTREGVPVRRPGYGSYLSAVLPHPVKNFAWFQTSDDLTRLTRWVAFAGPTMYTLSGAVGSGAGTEVGDDFFVSFAKKRARMYGDKLYIVTGYRGPDTYNGTSLANTPPNAAADNDFGKSYFETNRYIATGFDRVWYAGSHAYPQYLWPSEIGDPTYCKSTMAVKVDTQDGQDITGLLEWGDYILVPKERSIHAVPNMSTGASSFRVIRVTSRVGVPNGDTLVEWMKHAIFLGSDRKVQYLYLGQVADDIKPRSLSDLIQPLLDELTPYQVSEAEAVIWRDYYILAVGGKWFMLDLQTSELSNPEKCDWAVIEHATPQVALFVHPLTQELYSADATGQIRLHWLNGLTQYEDDAGTAIDWHWQTGWFSSTEPERLNLFTEFLAEAKATQETQSITVYMDTDTILGQNTYTLNCKGQGLTMDTDLLDTGRLGMTTYTQRMRGTPPSTGRRWRFGAKRGTDTKETRVLSVITHFRRLSALF